MIYKLKEIKIKDQPKQYTLEPYITEYDLPKKIYGSIVEKATYVWNQFAKEGGRASVLCSGTAGSGKSLFCKVLCNIASDQINVIIVSEIEVTIETINYISNLDQCLIFMDEFGKIVRWNMQDHFLTLLSDSNKKRMFLLTENGTSNINSFILNRPERVRYHFEFDTLDPKIIVEYCNDMRVPEEFKTELLRINMSNKKFCFDHLSAIVQEAKTNNNYDVDALIEMLNLKVLKRKEILKGVKVVNQNEDTELTLTSERLSGRDIVVIKVKDEIITKFAKTYDAVQNKLIDLAAPTPDVVAYNAYMADPVNVERFTRKYNMFKELQSDYASVDTDFETQDRWGDTILNTVKEGAAVKVNLAPENIMKMVVDDIVYLDVTGKYGVYINKFVKTL